MLAEISTILNCPPAKAWDVVRRPELLVRVTRPLVTFDLLEPRAWPSQWSPSPSLVRMKLFGVLPMGRQWIVPSIAAENATPGREFYQIRDQGHGDAAKVWDHLITLRAAGDGRTHYTDRVEVEAGWRTPLVWLFAQVFYRHRQRRWRKLVAAGLCA